MRQGIIIGEGAAHGGRATTHKAYRLLSAFFLGSSITLFVFLLEVLVAHLLLAPREESRCKYVKKSLIKYYYFRKSARYHNYLVGRSSALAVPFALNEGGGSRCAARCSSAQRGIMIALLLANV